MLSGIVCFDKTSIFTCTHGLDISGLHVLTLFTALDDYSHKKYLYTFISIQFGQNFDASNCETFKRDWDARDRSFNGRCCCASWIICAGSQKSETAVCADR